MTNQVKQPYSKLTRTGRRERFSVPRLWYLRRSRGLGLRELSFAAGVPMDAILMAEQNGARVKMRHIKALADYFSLPVSELMAKVQVEVVTG